MKEEKVHLCIPLSRSTIITDYYENTFRTKSYGAERAAEIYPLLRENALDSMKGIFSYDEIELLSQILNLGKDRFELSKEIFLQKIRDSIILQRSLSGKQKEMLGQVIKKIEKLEFHQVIILSEWFSTFNSLSETYRGKKKTISFQKYAARLIE